MLDSARPEASRELYCATCEGTYAAGERCPKDGTRLVRVNRPDPLVGREFDGRYTITGKLGQGGMGAVYRAVQHSFARDVAIKVMNAHATTNPEMIKRFLREAKLASRLSHPNAVAVLDCGETDDGVFYLVMELITGRTLADVIADDKLTPARVVRVGTQVCEALESAHALSIIHRDLKPSNIMVLTHGRDVIKILDFGLAKSLGAEAAAHTMTGIGTMLGTPAFMPPELATGQPCDGRADLYSLGCILFLLGTGVLPFQSDSVNELIAMHGADTAPPVTGVPAGLARIIERLLAKSPDERYQTATETREALEQCLAPEPAAVAAPKSLAETEVETAITARRPAEAAPRRRWSLAAVIALAVVAAAGAAIAMFASDLLDPDLSDLLLPASGGAAAVGLVVAIVALARGAPKRRELADRAVPTKRPALPERTASQERTERAQRREPAKLPERTEAPEHPAPARVKRAIDRNEPNRASLGNANTVQAAAIAPPSVVELLPAVVRPPILPAAPPEPPEPPERPEPPESPESPESDEAPAGDDNQPTGERAAEVGDARAEADREPTTPAVTFPIVVAEPEALVNAGRPRLASVEVAIEEPSAAGAPPEPPSRTMVGPVPVVGVGMTTRLPGTPTPQPSKIVAPPPPAAEAPPSRPSLPPKRPATSPTAPLPTTVAAKSDPKLAPATASAVERAALLRPPVATARQMPAPRVPAAAKPAEPAAPAQAEIDSGGFELGSAGAVAQPKAAPPSPTSAMDFSRRNPLRTAVTDIPDVDAVAITDTPPRDSSAPKPAPAKPAPAKPTPAPASPTPAPAKVVAPAPKPAAATPKPTPPPPAAPPTPAPTPIVAPPILPPVAEPVAQPAISRTATNDVDELPGEPTAVTVMDMVREPSPSTPPENQQTNEPTETTSITAIRSIPEPPSPLGPPTPAPTPRPTLPPGARRLGRFVAEGPVARGPSGPVFRSHDDAHARDVHIETMPTDLDLVTATAAIAQLAKLEHVNLVRVHELVVHAGRAYLVREPLTGRSLFQHVKERRILPWLEAVGVGDQLCAGLEVLHERSIFHRAIRPAWIVVEKKTIKLGGMAIAAGVHDRAWIAPEVIAGGEPDPRSDIYGVGAILYHCLCGEPPSGTLVNTQGPSELGAIVTAMLAKSPADRPASVRGLRDSFKSLFEV